MGFKDIDETTIDSPAQNMCFSRGKYAWNHEWLSFIIFVGDRKINGLVYEGREIER